MRQLFFVAGALLIAGCADQAATPVNVASANATPAAAPASSAQTCHREPIIGSNFMQTVCHSNDDHDTATNQAIDDIRRGNAQQSPSIRR